MVEQALLRVVDDDGYENGEFEVEVGYSVPEEESIAEIEERIRILNEEKDALNHQIDFLTSHADKLDIAVSACSGILTAALDALLKEKRIKDILGTDGGDLLDFLNNSGSQQVNKKIEKTANSKKTANNAKKTIDKGGSMVSNADMKADKLSGMVSYLEKRFNIPSDSMEKYFGGGTTHHLNDFAHHPSIVGLFFSLLTQFTMCCYGTNKVGMFITVPLKEVSENGTIAKMDGNGKEHEIRVIGRDVKEKVFFGTVVWYYHLISDLAGSSPTLRSVEKHGVSTLGVGAGVPGPLMSLAKLLSSWKIFSKKTEEGTENKFAQKIAELYDGSAFATKDGKKRKIDMRTELGLAKELKDQAIPVLINECIVRGFYFIRRFFAEIKEKNAHSFSELKNIDPEVVIPFKNRTIVRMMTVATSSFSATNLIIGATVGAVKSGGNPALFAKEFVLRINFVGLGRCAVAIGADVSSGIKKTKLEYQLGRVNEQIIALTNAKTYYCVGGTWKEIEDTEAATQELENNVVLSLQKAYDYWNAIKQNMERVEENIDVLTEDEAFQDHLLDILKWG